MRIATKQFFEVLQLAVVVFWLLAVGGRQSSAQDQKPEAVEKSSLFTLLTTEGLAITATQREKLPAPLLVPDQSAEARRELLENLSGANGWERFSRNSAVAPMAIDIDYVKNASGERMGHRIHVLFVAHASLSKLRDRNFMQQTFGRPDHHQSPEGFSFEELKKEELREFAIDLIDPQQVGFTYIEANLLDRVQIRGVIRAETFEQDSSLVVAWCLDSRFGGNTRRNNSWRKLTAADHQPQGASPRLPPPSGDAGNLSAGDSGNVAKQTAQPYSGCGGYLSLTQLASASDIVLIESWTLLHEPADWFQGSNLLRSKLPLTIQESVRSFRRKLAGQ